ncbi:hypothetical protein [Phyllobacterium leguminum]|uniref:Uncharacterized protein n=1 Tax=Phyllobacterium leguminum TaxID=314237 RepID=A0A318TE45_9HYPH|nr:hypothetical protein [Phyllobacterium leguminum]PYE89646.1 hypothetical protein C7477_103154 [Phyllobacterium leguminum]
MTISEQAMKAATEAYMATESIVLDDAIEAALTAAEPYLRALPSKTGGPAFPRPQSETSMGGNYEQDGMSLRDWYAGQAIIGLIQGYAIAYGSPTNAMDEMAREAFSLADIMLLARDGGLHADA